MIDTDPFLFPLSRLIWETRYRAPGEASVDDSWRRVAAALASVEADQQEYWRQAFLELLQGFRFPGDCPGCLYFPVWNNIPCSAVLRLL